MTSAAAAPSGNFNPSMPLAPANSTMNPVQEQSPSHTIKQEPAPERGRPPSRAQDESASCREEGHGADGDGLGPKNESSPSSSGSPVRKRRRSRKGLDKKYECQAQGCGKSYSRAEHLYRHQLNHDPKNIYKCDFPGCERTFVRLDLRTRHMVRHEAKGSNLSRKGSIASRSGAPSVPASSPRNPGPLRELGSTSPEESRPPTATTATTATTPYPETIHGSPFAATPTTAYSAASPFAATPTTSYSAASTNEAGAYMRQETGYSHRPALAGHHLPVQSGHQLGHQSFQQSGPQPSPQRPTAPINAGPYGVLSTTPNPHNSSNLGQSTNPPQPTTTAPLVLPQNFTTMTLPPSNFPTRSPAPVPREQPQPHSSTSMLASTTSGYNDHFQVQGPGDMFYGPNGPVIDYEAWLASLVNNTGSNGSPSVGPHPSPSHHPYIGFQSPYIPYLGNDVSLLGHYPPSQPQQVMSVPNLVVPREYTHAISEDKSQEIFDYIEKRFHDYDDTAAERQRASLIEGDRAERTHPMSRTMMQAYIGSYWEHFSEQIPILHKPTFNTEETHNLLLIAIMVIGASCHGDSHGQSGPHLSNFLAWHLRVELFKLIDSHRSPTKLWVFQTVLLLELYEKMFSTRELHERAHIHHGTAITLMRRSRLFLGIPTSDSSGASGLRPASATVPTPDELWKQWVENEVARRVVGAAFLLDSIHATMFGHNSGMAVHELRLALPCDDQLWKATNGAEVSRLDAKLRSNGIKPVALLDGVRRTLQGKEVQTNSFGRQILMAALLSISWHMSQRDLQLSSLGAASLQALGGREKWRNALTRAFETWKRGYDDWLRRNEAANNSPYSSRQLDRHDDEARVTSESRTVLYHLAHMTMHADIKDCQIFARARRLIGRPIGTQDLTAVERRMRDWARSPMARHAAYYALKFLHTVLLFPPENSVSSPESSSLDGYYNSQMSLGGGGGDGGGGGGPAYSAIGDVLMNRPWVLYLAALVVWCYGYALEGPPPPPPSPPMSEQQQQQQQQHQQHQQQQQQQSSSSSERLEETRRYLRAVAGRSLAGPDGLRGVRGVNNNSALLLVLKEEFEATRWELLHEGAALLENCVQLNCGGTIVF